MNKRKNSADNTGERTSEGKRAKERSDGALQALDGAEAGEKTSDRTNGALLRVGKSLVGGSLGTTKDAGEQSINGRKQGTKDTGEGAGVDAGSLALSDSSSNRVDLASKTIQISDAENATTSQRGQELVDKLKELADEARETTETRQVERVNVDGQREVALDGELDTAEGSVDGAKNLGDEAAVLKNRIESVLQRSSKTGGVGKSRVTERKAGNDSIDGLDHLVNDRVGLAGEDGKNLLVDTDEEVVEEVGDGGGDAGEGASDGVEKAGEAAEEATSGAGDSTSSAVDSTADSTSSAVNSTRGSADSAGDGVEEATSSGLGLDGRGGSGDGGENEEESGDLHCETVVSGEAAVSGLTVVLGD